MNELKCKLKSKGEQKGGIGKASGKQWQLMEFCVDKKDVQHPSMLDLKTFSNEVIMFLNDTSIGTELLVTYDVETRLNEYVKDGVQKSWRSTEAKAIKVEVLREDGSYQGNTPPPPPPIGEDDTDSLPF